MKGSLQTVRTFIVGTIIGIVAMIPGLSGAVLAVCLGVYERLIADLADLRHKLKEDFAFILLIGIGILVGTFIVSFGLEYVLENYEAVAYLFFTGLIIGQFPSLLKQTDRTKPVTKTNILALVIGLCIMVVMGALIAAEESEIVFDHDLTAYLCMIGIGFVFAISHLVPGISGTTIMVVLGVMTTLTTAITDLDIAFLIPICFGLLLGVLSFAKVVHHSIVNHRNTTYSLVIGLTVGSIGVMLLYVYNEVGGWEDIALGILFFFVGILVSMALSKLGKEPLPETSV
jgi:Predicted membrane protein